MANFFVNDYTEIYGPIMKFGQNKNEYIHRWYPFVEGYSREFIENIVAEYTAIHGEKPKVCLEPFSGSGTTALELQKMNILCYAFEVSPFMYNLSKVKLETKYTVRNLKKYTNILQQYINKQNIVYDEPFFPQFKTIAEKEKIEKWNFNKESLYGVMDIKNAIQQIPNREYRELFMVALASILLEVSNVYRNGKCISYKKGWKELPSFNRSQVHEIFFKRLNTVFLEDIERLNGYNKKKVLFSNKRYLFNGDVRRLLSSKVEDDSIDLVITSPPYLNSRDYTDTYMVELRVLGYLNTPEQVRNLRSKTIRSHVQVKWGCIDVVDSDTLSDTLLIMKNNEKNMWNKEIINMIKGYFDDMDLLFAELHRVVKRDGLIFFNIANSAYCNTIIKVDEIVCEIAQNHNISIKEIRHARKINPSSQQKDSIDGLWESVIVMCNL